MTRIALLTLCAALASCGPKAPMTEERARAQCSERAAAAAGPQTTIGIGIGTGGTSAGISIGLSADYLAGRSPDEVFDTCMQQLLGQTPRETETAA